MVLPVLAIKLLTIANITLERQSLHDSLTKRNNWENSYDFIMVGGGTAGSIVASRLSENPNWKVLLLEAGFQENPISDIPLLYPLVPGDPANDWGYRTVPQKQVCQNEPNKGCRLERGKFLGGCSSHNGKTSCFKLSKNQRIYK
jgi:choline dehydrogenase-like flavoprotein